MNNISTKIAKGGSIHDVSNYKTGEGVFGTFLGPILTKFGVWVPNGVFYTTNWVRVTSKHF